MAKDEKPLHIVSLTAENVKRIVAVKITPAGNLVEIRGKNRQGKTSILDSMCWALEGANAIQKTPIRTGQSKAWVRLDLGDYIVQRTFASVEDGGFTTSLTVDNAAGGRLQKGQTLLTSFLGSLTLDPIEFARMKPREQFDKLKGFVTGVDIEAIDAANRTDFDKRTDVKRRANEKAVEAGAIAIPDATPMAKVDESAITDELAEVGAFNATLERRAERREATAKEAADLRTSAAADKAKCDELLAEIQRIRDIGVRKEVKAGELEETLAAAEPLPAPKDAAEVRARLEAAKRTNAALEQAERRKKLKAEAEALDKEAEALTETIDTRENSKRQAIAEAKLPVDGVTFADGAILLNGVPFNQASDAEQLRASVAIAMAGEPRLRVLRIREGSLLDEDGLKLVATMAAERNFQVWLEAVDSSGTRGFVIEDGHVRTAPAAEPEQAAAE